MNDIKKLRSAVIGALEMANLGDIFLCCRNHVPDCPDYLCDTCLCESITISESTTVDLILAIYEGYTATTH